MRRPLLSALFVLMTWSPSLLAADDRPIPQNRARMERQSRDRLAWNRKTLVEEYDRAGRKDPRWDSAARETLEIAARRFSLQDPLPLPEDLFRAARRAVEAGCDDPLVLYIYSRTSTNPGNSPGTDEFLRRARRAAAALKASSYSPIRCATGELQELSGRIMAGRVDDRAKAEIADGLDAVVAMIAQSVAADPRGEFWEARWFGNLWDVYNTHKKINDGQSQTAFDRVDALIAKVPGIEALRLTFRGKFYAEFAWEARGDRPASRTGNRQFATFEERLVESRSSLEAAYKLNPDQPIVARVRVLIARGLGEDRETMEIWFGRAMNSDGDDEDACVSKFYYLSPRWHGDEAGADALAFGHACGATKNWRNGLELLESEAIYYQAMNMGDAERRKYLTRPENWIAIRTGYDDYLKRLPGDAVALSKYAFLAYFCEQYQAADAIFRRVGDNLTQWGGMNSVSLQGLQGFRAIAAKRAAEQAGDKAKPRSH